MPQGGKIPESKGWGAVEMETEVDEVEVECLRRADSFGHMRVSSDR